MGYFDALTSGSFKTGEDGRRLFFPWGILGGGYAIGSEESYQRLRRQVKAWMIVSFILIVGGASLQGGLMSIVMLIPLLAFYAIWMVFLLPGLEPTDERLSLQESTASQARAHSKVALWLLEIGSIAFVVSGIAILIFDPRSWLVAVGSILFFGLCAAKATHMLMLRRRAELHRA